MELWQYNACVLGYQDHLHELLATGIFTGYYAGYYHPYNKHPKDPVSIIRKMVASKKRSARKQEVDVAAFQALEQAFEAKRRSKGVKVKGGKHP